MEPAAGLDVLVWSWARGPKTPCRRSIVRVLPSERLTSGNGEGTPLPESHGELPPVIRRTELVAFSLAGLLLIAIVAVLYVGKAFFLPVVMAFVTGTMLSPAATFLEKQKVPRSLAAALIVFAVTAVVGFIVALIASPAMEWSSRLPELGAQLKDKVHVLDRPLALWRELQTMLGGSEGLPSLQMPKFEWVQPTIEFLSPTFTEFLLFFVTLILFIASWRDLRRAMIMTFSDHDARLRTLRILNEIEVHLGSYLLTVTLINVGVGVAAGLVCALTGMPNPAGLGALAATLNFIPIIGPVAMFAILVVVGLVTFPTVSGGLMAALAFGGITFLEGHFVTPTIIGRRLALNALAVLLALAFWTWLWGPMGAFLSSPLLIVALILKEHLLPEDSPQLPQD
ncbi:AI-2E family transporter [Bradyrhizobium sp. CSS354]|nr:AI-2E family transporter [Bradyrhizobium sp. CSS354]